MSSHLQPFCCLLFILGFNFSAIRFKLLNYFKICKHRDYGGGGIGDTNIVSETISIGNKSIVVTFDSVIPKSGVVSLIPLTFQLGFKISTKLKPVTIPGVINLTF